MVRFIGPFFWSLQQQAAGSRGINLNPLRSSHRIVPYMNLSVELSYLTHYIINTQRKIMHIYSRICSVIQMLKLREKAYIK